MLFRLRVPAGRRNMDATTGKSSKAVRSLQAFFPQLEERPERFFFKSETLYSSAGQSGGGKSECIAGTAHAVDILDAQTT